MDKGKTLIALAFLVTLLGCSSSSLRSPSSEESPSSKNQQREIASKLRIPAKGP